jgi:hypothetical protein
MYLAPYPFLCVCVMFSLMLQCHHCDWGNIYVFLIILMYSKRCKCYYSCFFPESILRLVVVLVPWQLIWTKARNHRYSLTPHRPDLQNDKTGSLLTIKEMSVDFNLCFQSSKHKRFHSISLAITLWKGIITSKTKLETNAFIYGMYA